MPNLYLIQKSDNTGDEVSADFYERQGDDWVFLLGGSEVAPSRSSASSRSPKRPANSPDGQVSNRSGWASPPRPVLQVPPLHRPQGPVELPAPHGVFFVERAGALG